MPRSREELVEALRDVEQGIDGDAFCDPNHAAALAAMETVTEAADLLDSLEEQGDLHRAASLQRCTILTTPWTDVEEGTDGC